MTELPNCPFCTDSAEWVAAGGWQVVRCRDKDCDGRVGGKGATMRKAAEQFRVLHLFDLKLKRKEVKSG